MAPHPQPSLNPDFVAMPATELIAHLNHHRRSTADFADASLVFAARERRLAEAEQRVRVGDKRVDRLLEGIRACDAQIHQAAVTEERLHAEIHALRQQHRPAADPKARPPLQQPRASANAKARTRPGSGPGGCGGLTQQLGRATQNLRA